MRKVTVLGLDDNLKADLGRNVELVAAVIEIGKAIDAITFEKQLTGKELKQFILQQNANLAILENIVDNYRYLLTAYDW
jgi:hypothetical protein